MGGIPKGENSSLFIHRLTEREATARDGKKEMMLISHSVGISGCCSLFGDLDLCEAPRDDPAGNRRRVSKVDFTELVVDTKLTSNNV